MKNWATKELPRPCAFIQWKGTNVCMDCYCVCGENLHIDAEFAYYVKCKCGAVYEMSAMIEMRKLEDGEEPRMEPHIDQTIPGPWEAV